MNPQALALTKAIKQHESGGRYDQKGRSQEYGAYQWTPATWKAHAREVLGDENADIRNPTNQNKVAYTIIEKDLKSGLTPAQAAAKWNSGSPTGWENKKGVNKFGVAYDVPAYVNAVGKFYTQELQKTKTSSAPVEQLQQQEKSSFLGNLVKAPLTILARPIQAVAELGGASAETVDKITKKLTGGLVAPVPQNASDIKKDVGRGIQTAALGLGPVSGGAAFGLGNSLEQGNDLFSKETVGQTALGAGGGKVLDVLGKPILNVASKAISKVTPQAVEDAVISGARKVADFASKREILPQSASQAINRGAEALETGLNKPFDLSRVAVKNMTAKSEKQIESAILKKYEKGVKPLLSGKTTPTKLQNYRDDVISAVKTIKENQPNLKFTDENGIQIVGETPKSLQQLTDSIEQTKKSIFTKYDTLAREAGHKGVQVQTLPIAQELETVVGNQALSITNPNAIKYAKGLQKRLLSTGNLDAKTAQDIIQNYNKSLEAFYRNPGYDTASQAAIDAMVVNRMRQSLDEGITKLTGTQYSALKKQYGALKSIEKDVIKASLRDARKNTKGLLDFTDILTGGDITTGLLTLNPVTLSRGLAGRGIKEFYKYLNDPNRAIEKMFQATDTYNTLLDLRKPRIGSPISIKRKIIKARASNQMIDVKAKAIGRSDTKLPTTSKKQINPSAISNIAIQKSLSKK